MASLSDNSIKQYDVGLKKWWRYCKQNDTSVYEASIPTIIYFLTQRFKSGAQYGTLNSLRSALSLIIGPTLSKDDRLIRFFKGVFRLRPPLPKYNVTWDTNIVLSYLRTKYPNEELSLDQLSKKCITLLALTTAHRVQTFSKIVVNNIEILSTKVIIKIPDIIKTTRLGAKQPILFLPFFTENLQICPATTLLCYVNRTRSLRGSNYLFVTSKRPHKAVTTQTLSRWIKCTLGESGVDISMFSAHSTRHATTSQARALGVNIDQIRNTAGWSGNSETFARFYNRVVTEQDQSSLARVIINNSN